jgi:hypothetical protein
MVALMSDLSEASNALFAGYLTEEEVASQRGRSIRTLRTERQRGDGPPWLRLGGLRRSKILYPVEGFPPG